MRSSLLLPAALVVLAATAGGQGLERGAPGTAGPGARAPAARPEPLRETIERVVAVVDERPLLLSDVRALQTVRGLSEAKALEAAIDERLMHTEAARLPQADVTPEEEDQALARLLETRPALRGAVLETDLRQLLRRQLGVLKYVEFRFRPQVRVSDEDVRKAWEEEQAGRPSGPALEDEQEAIRERLEREAIDERIEAWVAGPRARADVRYVPPPPQSWSPRQAASRMRRRSRNAVPPPPSLWRGPTRASGGAAGDGGSVNLAASAVSGQTPPAGPQWVSGLQPIEPHRLAYDKPLCASLDGLTLHAATRAGALQPGGREALLRYVLCPPIAQERLDLRPDGLVRITLKKAYTDGTAAVDMDPLSLLCRLASSVPPPRFHTVRYAGVLAASSPRRPRIVPKPPTEEPAAASATGG